MTTRPRLVDLKNRTLIPGLAAVGLFVAFAAVFVVTDFGVLAEDVGFPEGESIVAAIGMTLLGLDAAIAVENFLVPLLIVAVALDAALDGSLMLAKRDEVPQSGAAGPGPTDEPSRTAGEGGSSTGTVAGTADADRSGGGSR